MNSAQTLNNLMVDIWRIQHPEKNEYSFYSHVHQSFILELIILLEAGLISNIRNMHYHNILISDHSPG